MKILVVSLGGTITMTKAGPTGSLPTLDASDLVRAVPGLEAIGEFEAISPMRVASPSLTIEDMVGVARTLESRLASDVSAAIVVQGTDTIEETAFILDLLVRSDRPVVMIGAMRGADAAGADGPANLLSAAIVAASPEAAGLGTLVVLNDQVHAARYVVKAHTALTSAFASPLAGPVGLVAEGRFRLLLRPARTGTVDLPAGGAPAPVALVRMSLGDDGRLLPALPGLGYRGAVIEGMGAGHVPGGVASMVGELARAMPVVLSSRVIAGPVFTRTYGYAGAETDLIARGCWPSGILGGPKSRVLLSLLLGCGLERKAIGDAFVQRCG
jgi:L-asparaginase